MKKILIIVFLFTTQLSAKEVMPLCSFLYAGIVKKKIEPLHVIDKVKHCSASCFLTLKCGVLDSYSMGILKEVFDVMGMGNPELADIKANVVGIKLAQNKEAVDINECINKCTEVINDEQTDCRF